MAAHKNLRRRMGAILPISNFPGSVGPVYNPIVNYPVYTNPLTVPLQNPDIGTFGTPSAAAIPAGSYQQTSRNIYVDGNGYLYATCQQINGSWVQSPPLYYLDCVGDIANINGVLTCTHSGSTSTGLVPTTPPVATGIDPVTGQVYTGIPAQGPQPPGAGYQQVEAPGSTYPYVYIGGGSQIAPYQNPQGQQYSVYTTYNPGDTVTYAGYTWQAQTTVPAGVYPGLATGYWLQIGVGAGYGYYPTTSYTNPAYNNAAAMVAAAASGSSSSGSSVGSSISSFFSQYGTWMLVGLGALIIVPRVLPSRR